MIESVERKIIVITNGTAQDMGTNGTTWEWPADLSPKGLMEAKCFADVSQSSLAGCNIYACSTLPRAAQTLNEIMNQLDCSLAEFDDIIVSKEFWTGHPKKYLSDSPQDAADVVLKDPDFAKLEGSRFYQLGIVKIILAKMREKNEGTALCVSHPVPVSFLLAHAEGVLEVENAFDSRIRNFEGCEGIILTFVEQSHWPQLYSIQELRQPIQKDHGPI